MKKLLFLLLTIAAIACTKNEANKIVPDDTATKEAAAKRLARIVYLEKSVGTFYRYDDTLGYADSVKINFTEDSLNLKVFCSELDTFYTMRLDSILPDSSGQYTILPFSFRSLNYEYDDTIKNCIVTNALSTLYPNNFAVTYVFNGTYFSTLTPALNNTYVVGYSISRNYFR